MTALAGFWNFANPSVPKDRGERMLAAQAIYASGRPSILPAGEIVLARRLWPTLPEDRHDLGVLTGGEGRFLLIADVRLDNRDEIGADLDMGSSIRETSDSSLLLKAWERWEQGVLERLAGDFAFALWDEAEKRLFMARDPLGMRPLCYAATTDFLALASMPSGLHALSEIPYRCDDSTVADFLLLEHDTGSRTFFAGIHRVEPGCIVTASRSGCSSSRYWPPPLRTARFKTVDDAAEAAREKLDTAVAACLRGAGGRAAAHLSGGLDSSAVVATAARLLGSGGKVSAFTAVPSEGFSDPVPENRIADEGPLAAATAALYENVEHVLIRSGKGSPVAAVDRNFLLFQRPAPNLCNQVWGNAILDAARDRGHSLLLTGQLGNLSISHSGSERLAQLLSRGRLVKLGREWACAMRGGKSARRLAVQTLSPLLPASLWNAFVRWQGWPSQRSDFSLIRPEVDAAQQTVDYSSRLRLDGTRARLDAISWMDFGNFNKGILAGWGLDVRDPTADRRLMEFCLALPSEYFLDNGVSRLLARRCLADRLPPSVINETQRGYQAADWREGVSRALPQIEDEVARIANSPAAAGLLDVSRMQHLIAEWDGRSNTVDEGERLYRTGLLRSLSAGHFTRKVEGSNG